MKHAKEERRTVCHYDRHRNVWNVDAVFITNSTEHSRSWVANILSAGQEIIRLLWNSIHCRIHKSHHWSLSRTRWIQSIFSILLPQICFNIILPSTHRSPQLSSLFRLWWQKFWCCCMPSGRYDASYWWHVLCKIFSEPLCAADSPSELRKSFCISL